MNNGKSYPKTPYVLKSRLCSPYLLLLGIFIVSRVGYYLSGVRFDATGLNWYFQFLDPDLLRHHLLQSLFFLHIQPPGYNLFVGVMVKLFPQTYTAAFHAVHLMLGAAVICLLYYIMRNLGVAAHLAFISTSLFLISPGVVLFENFILYEYQIMFFLTVSAVFLLQYVSHHKVASAIGFLVCQFWLVMLRNQYHLVYFAVIFALLLYFSGSHHRRMISIAGSLLFAVILALYLKNQILFGKFVSSTWLGMNISHLTTLELTPEEKRSFVSQGKISRLSAELDIGVPLSSYKPYIVMPSKTSIPVLDREVTSTNAPNLNHLAILEVQKIRMRDGLYIIRHYPKAYVRSIAIAWFTYFLPADDFLFFDPNRVHIRKIERFFDIIFFGQFKQAPGKILRGLYEQGASISLLLYTGVFLLIGLPAVFICSVWFLYRDFHLRSLDLPRELVIGFILFNIVYITLISNFFGSFENNRYRFPIDGFYVILAALALQHVKQKLLSRFRSVR
jgi:hypothetical protein